MANESGFDYDLVIIGAGLTGLSLACWLMELGRSGQQAMPSVCLLEPRTSYQNDRTWCFWDLEQQPFRELITHRWFRWQVRTGQQAANQSDDRICYAMLPAQTLYRHALERIEASPGFSLRQGVMVQSIEEAADGVRIHADAGQWQARIVVDTRPPQPAQMNQNAGFWQAFTGYEIHCPDHGYEIDTARLMDFQHCREHTCFVYLLPKDRNHLLVEWTEFQPHQKQPHCRQKLESWLAAKAITDFQLIRSESAVLPMMPFSGAQRSGRVIRAGVGAGWMRAATGYHFASCQRGSRDLARQILEASSGGHWQLHPPAVRSRWLNWMDRVFLRALHSHPEQAPQWFLALFAGTSAAQMARFMNDQPRWSDALAIARALPPGPFLRAVLS